MKAKIQSFGRFLSAMVMPNIGAFIAWGLFTALFLETGWLPNADLATVISPFLTYALPLMIAYQGGKLVGGDRGALMGVIATMGVICGTEYTMFLGAMAMGPLAGWVIKVFDKAVEGKIKAGFEMLVNNFSIGILGLLMAIVGYYGIGPIMAALLAVLTAGVNVLVNHGLLPLVSLFVEPAKVLFLNNAINHGLFTPLGAEQVQEAGKSIFYMIETNPGPGTGVLCAYWVFCKDKKTRDSAPGALIVHLLGGIHEISFPYILMNPLLILATMAGSCAAMLYNTIFDLGLAGPAAPGSIFAFLAMAPRGSTFACLLSIVIAAAVSFGVAAPIILMGNKKSDKKSLEDAQASVSDMKAESKGQVVEAAAEATETTETAEVTNGVDLATITDIIFACDAGMGSSAMGATILKKKLADAGIDNITVNHASVSSIPEGIKLVVCHEDLAERAAKSAPDARLVTITNFMAAPEYDMLINEIVEARK